MTDQFVPKELCRYDTQSPADMVWRDALFPTQNAAPLHGPRRMFAFSRKESPRAERKRSPDRDIIPALFRDFTKITVSPKDLDLWG